jgi:hypothetical protein
MIPPPAYYQLIMSKEDKTWQLIFDLSLFEQLADI